MKPANTNNRITVIDALRGFTLLGVLIVHTQNLWGFPQPTLPANEIWAAINQGVDFFINTFCKNKFNTIFSLMFGISFCIQLQRAEAKGGDFRMRFIWRMLILIVIGYLHELIYTWEALLMYGLLGIPLVLFYKLDKKWVFILAILCLGIHPFHNMAATHFNAARHAKTEMPVEMQQKKEVYAQEADTKFSSAATFFKYNLKNSTIDKVKSLVSHGPFRTFGLFLMGVFLSKIHFFEQLGQKKTLYKKILFGSLLGYLLLTAIGFIAGPVIPEQISAYPDYFFSAAILVGFLLLYTTNFQKYLDYLIPYGKMGLTNYIMQSIYGLLIFAPFTLGLHILNICGRELISLIFFVLSSIACTLWLKHYMYGPTEWLWRSLTYLKIMPFKKK